MTITNAELAAKANTVILGHQSFVNQQIGWLTSHEETVTLVDPYDPLVTAVVKTPWQMGQEFDELVDPVSGTVATVTALVDAAEAAADAAESAYGTTLATALEVEASAVQAASDASAAAASAAASAASALASSLSADAAADSAAASATSVGDAEAAATASESSATASALSASEAADHADTSNDWATLADERASAAAVSAFSATSARTAAETAQAVAAASASFADERASDASLKAAQAASSRTGAENARDEVLAWEPPPFPWRWTGPWDILRLYVYGDVLEYEGSTYIMREEASDPGIIPTDEPDIFHLVALRGEDGIGGGGGVTDGDKGHIVVSSSGAVWEIDVSAVGTALGLGGLATASTINNAQWSGTALSVANGGTGSTSASAARTELGLGALATLATVDNTQWSGTALAVANGGTGSTSASAARTALGLGTLATASTVNNAQWSGTVLAVANGGTGSSSAGTARTNLGLGTLATASTINGGDWLGADLALADGGTGASTASAARTNLGLGTLATLDDAPSDGSLYGRLNGAWAVSPGDGWTYAKLTSDFSTSSTTASNVTALSFTPATNKSYIIEGMFLLRSAATTTGVHPGVTWPSTLTDGAVTIRTPMTTGTDEVRYGSSGSGLASAASTSPGVSTNSYLGTMSALMITGGSTSGTFNVTLKSEINASSVTIRAASFIRYKEI